MAVFLRFLFLVGVASAYKHAVFLEQLDGTTCLPGDKSQPDQILFQEVPGTEGCVPENMVGIEFSHGEFSTRWKGLYLHRREDMNSYRQLMELKNNESAVTMVLSYESLIRLDVICLWKEVSYLTGWSRVNVYFVRNTHDLSPGRMYRFHWARDEVCT